MDDTKISWAHHTWNPWVGCTKVSEGCANCYMYREQWQRRIDPTIIRRCSDRTFNRPKQKGWNTGNRIFVCSYSDFWIEEADAWRYEAFELMNTRRDLIFLIPTKRPERIDPWFDNNPECAGLPNVWLGFSAENQDRFDERFGIMSRLKENALLWCSMEPLLGQITFVYHRNINLLKWVVFGGESCTPRNRARPLLAKTAKRIVSYCHSDRIPVWFKQWGEYDEAGNLVGRARSGDLIFGERIQQLPEQAKFGDWRK